MYYAETPVVDGGALMPDLSYSYFFGDSMRFGVFGGAGLGVGNLSEMKMTDDGGTKGGKFIWDLPPGFAIRIWQR